MKITEIFNDPIPASKQYTDTTFQSYNFSVSGIKYEIVIGRVHPGEWEVSFDAETSPGVRTDQATGTGNEIKVFSTVYNYVNQFLSQKLPEINKFTFTSEGASRTKLYQRLAAMWAKNHGMTVARRPYEYIDDATEFVLVNPAYRK